MHTSSLTVAIAGAWALSGIDLVDAEPCCTWNHLECGTDVWCNTAEENCLDGCDNGKWVDLDEYTSDGCCFWGDNSECSREYEYCDAHQSNCEGACKGKWRKYEATSQEAQPSIVLQTPESDPQTSQNPNTQSDVGTLTNSFPSGPYVSVNKNSETITLPYPALPKFKKRKQCPHSKSMGPMLKWHSSKTWESSPTGIPQEGKDVILPANSKVIIKKTISNKLGFILIPEGTELIVGEHKKGIHIHTKGIEVKGKLTIGSETCRIKTKVIITLLGQRTSNAVTQPPSAIVKGISVHGGTLNLHGKRYFNTWSRLARTVFPGDKVVMLQNSVNWESGQKIVLVTSAMQDSRDHNQNEVLTIQAVESNPPTGVGAVVYLKEPVQYKHTANDQYQVEVGLLSHKIVIRGSIEDSLPVDPDPLTCRHDRADVTWDFYYQSTQPCTDKELTGYGGHIIVHEGGKGHVEGVELYRMGQTNVMGRYPMHFHLLGECPTCYFRDSSIHKSYYRCISIHGTHKTTVSENVAYDVTGYCYYLEDGVEQENTIAFNLAAHIHTIGPEIVTGEAQTTRVYYESSKLTVPADVTASGFYITNVHNYIEGNAASGGWAGFALPSLPEALGRHRSTEFRPSSVVPLVFDGNTAHSSGWWWGHASPFYIGGALYYGADNKLEYNPGRSFNFDRDNRNPCHVNACAPPYDNCWCPRGEEAWMRITNSKAFLSAGVGLNSWSGRIEVIGFEAHDVRLGLESLSSGFWADNLLVVCRTGENLGLQNPSRLEGSGFFWYDTAQSHIITDATFRNCGYHSDEYDQYDTSPSRGCSSDDAEKGCSSYSTVFALLTHSDQHTPEVMQATRNINYDSCGRRFKLTQDLLETVSGRGQNWLDTDGSVSGLGEEIIIGSGLEGAKDWWGVEDEVVYEPQAPLRFIRKNNGPERSVAHVRLSFDSRLHDQVGGSKCGNGSGVDCPVVGYVRHLGRKFKPSNSISRGLPVTYNPDIVGPAGGYGWLLSFDSGSPRKLSFNQLEIDPSTTLMISIPYPIGTKFDVYASGSSWCWTTPDYSCKIQFDVVGSVDDVRDGPGNRYHVDAGTGILTLKIIESPNFVGDPDWLTATYESRDRDGVTYALPRFERDGILLPQSTQSSVTIHVKCPSDPNWLDVGYCAESTKKEEEDYNPDVCGDDDEYVQIAYDKCCKVSNKDQCKFADGSRNF